MSKGTNIYYISGHGSRVGAIDGYYPNNLTADSVPDIDNLFPFNSYWIAQAYVDWFAMNVAAYGLQVAQNKMFQAMDQWSNVGAEITYCNIPNYAAYFKSQGIDVTSYYCKLSDAASSVVDTVQNTANAASSVTGVLKVLLPFAIVGGIIWGVSEYGKPALDKLKRK